MPEQSSKLSFYAESMIAGAPFRAIIKFAVPLILGYILQQMYLIIDAAIVGRWIGVGALAAVGASSSIMFLIMGFCNGSCAGFAIPIAKLLVLAIIIKCDVMLAMLCVLLRCLLLL